MGDIPIYQEVYGNLNKLIRDGDYEVGEFLPPEGDLEQMYDVSRTTIRKAVNMLVSEGYVEVKQGRGTKILDFNSTQKLNGVTSISETLRKKGMQVEAKSIYIDIVEATKRTAERLKVDEGTKLYRVQRIQLADGKPVAIMENFIGTAFTPNLDTKINEIHSLYAFLEEEYGLHIDYAKDVISAKSADFVESQMLDVRVGAALLTLRRVSYTNGRPLTFDRIIIRADRYQFEIDMMGRNK